MRARHVVRVLLCGATVVTCLASAGCGKPGYRKTNGRWTWAWSDSNTKVLSGVDAGSFVVLADCKYGKDRSHVFYEGRLILNADPDSFVLLPTNVGWFGQCYAKDRCQVFLQGYPVTGADPGSFEIIDAPYARDRTRVYCGTVPMEGSDPRTFQQIRSCTRWIAIFNKEDFVQRNGPGFGDLEVSESRPAITSGGRWAKDAKHHYRDAARVQGADYETFRAIDDTLGVDKDHEYHGPFRKEDFDRDARLRADAARAKAAELKKQQQDQR